MALEQSTESVHEWLYMGDELTQFAIENQMVSSNADPLELLCLFEEETGEQVATSKIDITEYFKGN